MTADSSQPLVVGVGSGTLPARAVVVRADDGAELGAGLGEYAHGAIERTLPSTRQPLPLDWALQDPGDRRAVLGTAVREALRDAGRPERAGTDMLHRLRDRRNGAIPA